MIEAAAARSTRAFTVAIDNGIVLAPGGLGGVGRAIAGRARSIVASLTRLAESTDLYRRHHYATAGTSAAALAPDVAALAANGLDLTWTLAPDRELQVTIAAPILVDVSDRTPSPDLTPPAEVLSFLAADPAAGEPVTIRLANAIDEYVPA